MRNLQKILALVLALVMSLSLMATAGATDFTDGDSITDTFAESVKVLDGLKVFQGYPEGDFRPQGEITRAEVAAIIYRIATGDVGDTQVGIYADYDVFDDVYASEPISGWAAGYINYCANAEYVKGRGNGKFDPAGKVTGYEALAMILRAVGYDKNGEFTGADWQVQTAAIANQRKVTQNINAGMLGQPATREMVAEILCKAILLNKVNYTLAYGYQISTNDQDTIAYDTFQMECLTGVVTGNEIADLENSSPMAASQTRMVVDGEEKVLNFATGLDSIGKSVRAYIRPQGGTTVKELVSGETFDTELNHVYDSFAPVSSVGNSTGSENGINSIVGAEHFINYDFVNRWTANIRITYAMDVHWTEYQAKTMLRDNGGELWSYDSTQTGNKGTKWSTSRNVPGTTYIGDSASWNTQFTTGNDFTYVYEKTIKLDEMLTSEDYTNLYSIFTDADQTVAGANNWLRGAVYVGTASFAAQDDISDEIRWTDFVNTYLVNKDNRAQVESNGRGNRLIIIDNDDDGIAEYVLQTIYTIAKVSSDLKNVDIINQKLYDSDNNDNVNSTTPSNTLVSVSGKELAKSEDTLAAGDVVIYALIDGNIRAQKAETKTEKVNTVNRAAKTFTVVGEDAATYYESAVHTHSNNLTWGVNGIVGNTTYTMYFDLDGNMAAYTEGANGGLVLITNGWYNSAITGSEYAVQAYLDGSLQTVNVGASGAQFIGRVNGDNRWGNLRADFGRNDATVNVDNRGPINGNPTGTNNTVRTIIANLDGNNLTPVDQAYLYSQNLRILDMVDNVRPGMNNVQASWGIPYETVGQYRNNYPAYNVKDNDDTSGTRPAGDKYNDSYEVRGLSNTVYYVVYRGIGTDTMTNGTNVVVRSYTGSAPSLTGATIEDVYAVGAKATATTASGPVTYYTAQMVVIEVAGTYNRTSEQVFIPDFSQVTNAVGIEDVTMIRETGEKVTVQVDMRNSQTYDWYNTAEDTTINDNDLNRTRLPGLYFMDPSDTNPEVYVIERMQPDDIRDSNYQVGFVRESLSGSIGTMSSRYPQIELKIRPVNAANTSYTGPIDSNNNYYRWISNFGNGTDVIVSASGWTGFVTAQRTIPGDPVGDFDVQRQGKSITDNSKLYTYGGTTATLVEDSAYNVFAQNRQDNAGTSVSGLNERWDGVSAENAPNAFSQPNRNEVLVRYNGSGNIIWAVSFNETTAAQRVWWNCLPVDEAPDTTTSSAPALVELTTDGNTAARARIHTLVQELKADVNGSKNNILYNNWKPIENDTAYIEVTPAPGNTCWVNGVKFTETKDFKLPVASKMGGADYTLTVISQLGSKDPVTTTYTVHYQDTTDITSGVGTLKSADYSKLNVTPVGGPSPYTITVATGVVLTYKSVEEYLTTTTGAEVKITKINDSAVNDIDKNTPVVAGAKCTLTATKGDATADWTANMVTSGYTPTNKNFNFGDGITATLNGKPVTSPFTVTDDANQVIVLVADGEGQFVKANGTVITSVYDAETNKTTATLTGAISNNFNVTFVKTPTVDARIDVYAKAGTAAKLSGTAPDYTVTVPFGTTVNQAYVSANWQNWVTVNSSGSPTVAYKDNVVTLTLAGTGGGKDAKVTLTFVADTKVDAVDDPRFDYSQAGITAVRTDPDATNHFEVTVTVDKNEVAKHMTAAGPDAILSPMINPTSGKLVYGVSVTVPDGTTSIEYTYANGATGTYTGAAMAGMMSNGRYQDWVTIGHYDSTNKQLTYETGGAGFDSTRLVFKNGSEVLGEASWVFNLVFAQNPMV